MSGKCLFHSLAAHTAKFYTQRAAVSIFIILPSLSLLLSASKIIASWKFSCAACVHIFRCDCPACVADSLEMRCGRNYNYFAELHSCSQPCAFSFVFLKSLAFSKLLYTLGLPKTILLFYVSNTRAFNLHWLI